MTTESVFTGCMPALMTPCSEQGGLRLPDFDTDMLLLHFQDLVNIQDGRVL